MAYYPNMRLINTCVWLTFGSVGMATEWWQGRGILKQDPLKLKYRPTFSTQHLTHVTFLNRYTLQSSLSLSISGLTFHVNFKQIKMPFKQTVVPLNSLSRVNIPTHKQRDRGRGKWHCCCCCLTQPPLCVVFHLAAWGIEEHKPSGWDTVVGSFSGRGCVLYSQPGECQATSYGR